MPFTTDLPGEPRFGVLPEGVEIRRVLIEDEPPRPTLNDLPGPRLEVGPHGIPVLIHPDAPELQVPEFTIVARTEEQLNARPNFAEVLRQAQEQMARAGVPPQLFDSPFYRGKRTKTRLTKCNKCNAVLGEADQEAGKCTTCGAFYNVPVPKAEDVEPIKVVEDEDGRAIRTCPNCGNFTTVDPTYGDLCYRCIRAANE